MNHSDFFAERRTVVGLSQAKIGQLLGYSSQSVAAWESGRSFPDLVVWSKYASILGVDLEGFILAKDIKKNNRCECIEFDKDKFAKYLKYLRKKNNLILSDLSKYIGVNPKTISAWEKCLSFPNLQTYLKLCNLYKLTIDELYFVIQDNKNSVNTKPLRRKRIFLPIILPIIITVGATGGGVTAAVINSRRKQVVDNIYYTITWKNFDGTILEVDENILKGSIPEYNGETPYKTNDEQYTYTFDGWSPKVVEANANTTYTAIFKNSTNSYSVRWENYDGALLYEESYEYGDTPVYKGEDPTRSSDEAYSYVFDGWSPEVVEVKTNVTYIASYKSSVNTYSVRWEDYDGTLLYEEAYEYGETPTYKGEEPTRVSDDSNSYIFNGWSPSLDVVHGNQIYKAEYKSQTLLSYNLVDYGGKEAAEITGCDESIADLVIPSKIDDYEVRGIASNAFRDNSTLTSITISEGVTYIGENTFRNCSSLKNVKLPDSLETIYGSAFFDCTSLIDINIPDKVTSLSVSVFTNCNALSIDVLHLYDNAYYIGSNANPYLQLFRAKDKNITSCNIINDPMCKHIAEKAFLGCDKLTSIDIPSNIIDIGQEAFTYTSITSITIPEGYTELDYCIFYDCPLKTIYLPSTLKAISHGAFYGTELECIVIDDYNPHYKSYDGVLYSKDMSRLISYPGNKSGNIYAIPEQTTEIGSDSFPNGCPFNSLIMHDKFAKAYTTIDSLSNVYYLGTTEQWKNVSLIDYTGNVHFYSEVEVADPQVSYWHYVDGVPTLWSN